MCGELLSQLACFLLAMDRVRDSLPFVDVARGGGGLIPPLNLK